MGKINQLAHVVYSNYDVFNKELWKVVEEFQKKDLHVDVQYEARTDKYSALVIARELKEQ